jgi:ParB-like chromosome segregation protein Spo0J
VEIKMNLKIDPEFKAICRKLTQDEYNGLEADIKEFGCNDPILLWDGVIIDGHNRYEICQKHGIDFRTLSLHFDSRADALLYMIDHQLARRNLHELDKVALLEAKRPILEKQARERQKACLKQGDKYPVPENLPERGTPGETREKLASEIGISGKTYSQLKTVNQKGSDELKEAVREKKIGASKAAEIAKLPKEDQPEFLGKAIEQKRGAMSKKKGHLKPSVPIKKAVKMSVPNITITISKIPENAADTMYLHFGKEWCISFANHIFSRAGRS